MDKPIYKAKTFGRNQVLIFKTCLLKQTENEKSSISISLPTVLVDFQELAHDICRLQSGILGKDLL